MDELTSFASRALDFLFLKNPTRTSLGIVIGVMLSGFSPVFSPVFLELTNIDLSVVHPAAWIALGVLVSSLRGSPIKEKLPEEIELAFDLLKKAEEAGLSKDEVKNRYKLIAVNYIRNIGLNLKAQNELEEIKNRLRQDQS